MRRKGLERLVNKDRKISVIGMGYVGLPVAVAFGRLGEVIGFDIDERRIAELKDGHDNTAEISAEDLSAAAITFTTDSEQLEQADFHIVAVPTPINDAKNPDMEPLIAASETLGRVIGKGDIVVYESTVYPGATEEICAPILERESGLVCGWDFYLGYSPERINPGDKEHTFTNIVKIVSAQDRAALDVISHIYGSVVTAGVYEASYIKVAEATKVVENVQRDVNIALMNQLALIFDKLDIDTNDVLDAAATKWNFLRFTPGLVGGHCIGIDPYYLTYRAARSGYIPDLILTARSINDGLGSCIASRVVKTMMQAGYSPGDCLVTVLGLTFKENVGDTRNTRVIDIIDELKQFNVRVQVNDVYADPDKVRAEYQVDLVDLDSMQPAEVVILAVPHAVYLDKGWDWINSLLKGQNGIVYDVKGRLDREAAPAGVKVMRL